VDSGIMLTGGGALLRNLDGLLRNRNQASHPHFRGSLSAVAVGAGKALDNLSILRGVARDFAR